MAFFFYIQMAIFRRVSSTSLKFTKWDSLTPDSLIHWLLTHLLTDSWLTFSFTSPTKSPTNQTHWPNDPWLTLATGSAEVMNSSNPFIIQLAWLSPGCTRAEITTPCLGVSTSGSRAKVKGYTDGSKVKGRSYIVQGGQIWFQIKPDWHQMGQIWDFLKMSFRMPKSTENWS